MTLESVKQEMALIRQIKKTDIQEARERWKALKIRIDTYMENNKMPSIWRKVFLDEISAT